MKCTYDDWPVTDATMPLFIDPTIDDIKHAIRGDPDNCAYAISLKRTLGIDHTHMWRSSALVQATNAKGKKLNAYIRYVIRGAAYAYLRDFDEGEQRVPMETLVLSAPSSSQRLDYVRPKPTVDYTSKTRKGPKIRKPVNRGESGMWRVATGKIRYHREN